MRTLLLLGICLGACLADVHFKEEFDDGWEDRWVQSKNKDDYGKFVASSGKWYGDKKRDQGIKTSQDARFYALSTRFDKFSNRGKPLVVQFTVKHEQNIDCGGGYIKIASSDIDQEKFNGETPYQIMFGSDICGPSNRKVHAILDYKGKNYQNKKNIACKDDDLTHLYTLIINPDNTYEVQIDGSKVEGGKLEEDYEFLPAKTIKDPEAKKPEDWDDREMVADPDDKKPSDWDQPEHIADEDAKQPEDWDTEMDGEWEAPMKENPLFKGIWKPKDIKNPEYKGKWIHPEIDNPDYAADDDLYLFEDLSVAAFDLWQVKSGTIFDNVLITDDVDEAKSHAAETYEPLRDAEKRQKEKFDEEEKKRLEEEDKKRKEEEATKKGDDDKDDDEPEADADEEDEEDNQRDEL